jgi:hypothetical protein
MLPPLTPPSASSVEVRGAAASHAHDDDGSGGVTLRATALKPPPHRRAAAWGLCCSWRTCALAALLAAALALGFSLWPKPPIDSVATVLAAVHLPATELSAELASALRCDVAAPLAALGVLSPSVAVSSYTLPSGPVVPYSSRDPVNMRICENATAASALSLRARRLGVMSCLAASMTANVRVVNLTLTLDSKQAAVSLRPSLEGENHARPNVRSPPSSSSLLHLL